MKVKTWCGVSVVASLLLVSCSGLTAVGLPPAADPPVRPEGGEFAIAAVVNAEPITRQDIEKDVRLDSEYRSLPALYSGELLAQERRSLRERALDRLIMDRLMLQLARREGVALSDDDRRLCELRIDEAARPYGSRGALEAELAAEGATLAEFRRTIEQALTVRKLEATKVLRHVYVSPEEVRAFFEALTAQVAEKGALVGDVVVAGGTWTPDPSWREKLSVPGAVTIRELRLDREQDGRDEVDALARKVAEELKAGAPFEDLVKKHSRGPRASSGGLLTVDREADLLPVLADAVAKLAPAEVSPPIVTGRYLYIVQLVERRRGTLKPFDDVHVAIRDLLRARRVDADLERWRDGERERAYVRKFPEAL